MRADLKMSGAFEAVDGIFSKADSASIIAVEAIGRAGREVMTSD